MYSLPCLLLRSTSRLYFLRCLKAPPSRVCRQPVQGSRSGRSFEMQNTLKSFTVGVPLKDRANLKSTDDPLHSITRAFIRFIFLKTNLSDIAC